MDPRRIALLTVMLFLGTGCANPAIVQISPDTYLLIREDHAGIFGSLAKLKAGVIRDANSFAASQGKIAIPISTNERPVGNGPAQWARVEYQFRVVDESDAEAVRTSLVPRADVVVEETKDVTVTVDTDPPSDLYSELIKLDDLRKRGILTEEEFAKQKSKLLENQ